MYCLRCGRDTQEDQVFCETCRQNMELYPVKPGIAIHLPHRAAPVAVKKRSRRKRQISPEEQVLHLRKSLRQSRTLLVAAVLLLCLAVTMLAYEVLHPEDPIIGRNYTINTTQPTD